MYITILGRQPSFGVAELEALYGADAVRWFYDNAATVQTENFVFDRLGGSQKAGRVINEINSSDWSKLHTFIAQYYLDTWRARQHKITLGISVYNIHATPAQIQRTGLELKKRLRAENVSLRLIPNQSPALNTAVSHHNKLGLSENKVELLIVAGTNGKTIIAESIGAQNITALAARDQARPKTDAFVGMLPPKLARIMLNVTLNDQVDKTILDPFCGTGVVLQEALLLGHSAYGSDLSEKMVDYSLINLEWLRHKHTYIKSFFVEQGDAMKHRWNHDIDAVVCESYLGQPFSAPPSPAKLAEVRGNCNHIISTFLRNIHEQLPTGTPLTVAVPAWKDTSGRFTHLPLTNQLTELGYRRRDFKHVRPDQLLYHRENQVVARELLLLERN